MMTSVYEDCEDLKVGFLHLPTEIRLRIYEYLFSTSPSLISIRSVKRYARHDLGYGSGRSHTRQILTHTFRVLGPQDTRPFVLLACKTTYTEAWSTFWRFAILHWGAASQEENPDLRQNHSLTCSESDWDRHVTRGSNVPCSVERDLPRILSVYDNLQMSYTIGFTRELYRLLPNLKLLTVRRDWDTTVLGGGMFTGTSRAVDIDLPDVSYQIIPVTDQDTNTGSGAHHIGIASKFSSGGTSTRAKKRKNEQNAFEIVGITHESMEVAAMNQITTFRRDDLQHKRLNISNATLPWSRYCSYDSGSRHENVQLTTELDLCRKATLSPYLLAASRDQRGFAVHMHFAIDAYISHKVNRRSHMRNRLSLTNWRGHRGEELTQRLLVRKLDVTYDWDTGELVDLEVRIVRDSIGPSVPRE